MENNKQYESLRIKLQKLQALAERGEEGEALNARRAIERICADMGLNMDEVLDTSAKKIYTFEIGRGEAYLNLFLHCLDNCCDDTDGLTYTRPTRSSISIHELTALEYADTASLYNWHKRNYEDELHKFKSEFLSAYIGKHDLFFKSTGNTSSDTPCTITDEDIKQLQRIHAIRDGMGNNTYHKQLESE